ncbi:MAG: hypothetical protein OQK79_12680 [Rhodanobacter sp.]|nr:hypothetical protein [Rhodanobacter sp.]
MTGRHRACRNRPLHAAELFDHDLPPSCEYVADYTALRAWDFKPCLSHAEIRITEHGWLVASASYHLNGKGGFDMGKWRGTKAKMDPVMMSCWPGFTDSRGSDPLTGTAQWEHRAVLARKRL